MKTHQATIGNNQEWLTPPEIIQTLGTFDLDPCSPPFDRRPWNTALWHYTEIDDGLSRPWWGRVWCNPPFDRRVRPLWMKKMAEHNFGTMLVPAACETRPFFDYVYGRASGILMLKGRPHFHYTDGTRANANSGCTICLISYGEYDFKKLYQSNLGELLVVANRLV